jgi:hypothetical protein
MRIKALLATAAFALSGLFGLALGTAQPAGASVKMLDDYDYPDPQLSNSEITAILASEYVNGIPTTALLECGYLNGGTANLGFIDCYFILGDDYLYIDPILSYIDAYGSNFVYYWFEPSNIIGYWETY